MMTEDDGELNAFLGSAERLLLFLISFTGITVLCAMTGRSGCCKRAVAWGRAEAGFLRPVILRWWHLRWFAPD